MTPIKEVGIKETKEMITMLGELSHLAGKVMADGTLSAADLATLPELFTKYSVFEAGVKDIDEVLKEMANLDQAEVMALIGCVYAAVNRFAEGKKA